MRVALLSPAGAMHRYNGMFHKNLHYAPITLALLAALIPDEDVVIYDETAEPDRQGITETADYYLMSLAELENIL